MYVFVRLCNIDIIKRVVTRALIIPRGRTKERFLLFFLTEKYVFEKKFGCWFGPLMRKQTFWVLKCERIGWRKKSKKWSLRQKNGRNKERLRNITKCEYMQRKMKEGWIKREGSFFSFFFFWHSLQNSFIIQFMC